MTELVDQRVYDLEGEMVVFLRNSRVITGWVDLVSEFLF